MYTVRQLITEAFRKSTVRGLTDTPEADEVETALDTLNTELDRLTSRAEFSVSKRSVRAVVGRDGFVTISDDQKRVIVSADATVYGIKLNTGDVHGMSVGDRISVRIDGKAGSFKTTVIYVTGLYSFNTLPIDGITGTFSGTFKLASQGPEYDIGILDCPPDNIYQVIDENGWQLPELQEQDFYANKIHREFDWYFYDKSRNPYPRVWVGGKSTVTIVYAEPFWHDLKLDTDITGMPRSAQTTLKYMLAECLAEENGYTDIADRLHRKFSEAYADYCRSVTQSASPLPDFSAPGYFRTDRYNIENDGVGSGWRI
jgi:hypothetical protein